MARLEHLPLELFREISSYLSPRDISTVSRLNKRLHWLLFEEVFQYAYRRKVSDQQSGAEVLTTLLSHAIQHDSVILVEWVLARSHELDLNGYIPRNREALMKIPRAIPNVTYLQIAILKDAPKVVTRLVKYGTDIKSDMGDYPDLTPLYMTLAQCRVSSAKALDVALRIACTYALPRTTRFLLNNMANPNYQGSLGISALHCAVSRKIPYPRFESLSSTTWELMIEKTVHALLDFNADMEFQMSNPRIHKCGHKCWHSFDCDSSGQTALQLAAGRGLKETVNLLLYKGADTNSANEDGFRVLYTALAQGHVSIAIRLLECLCAKINPIVHEQTGMTALHAACRFAVPEVVLYLLKRGARVNAPDIHGITPLHEVLGQTCFGTEDDVLDTLDCLDEYGANPDIDLGAGIGSPRKLGQNHPSPEVRVLFIEERPKECKLRFRAPKPRIQEIPQTPPATTPPKVPAVHSASNLCHNKSSGVPTCINDVTKDIPTKNIPEKFQKKKKPWKPRKSRKSKDNLPLPNDTTKMKGSETFSEQINGPEEFKNTEKDQTFQGVTKGIVLLNVSDTRCVEPLVSRPADKSAGRFLNSLPKK
ncbi:ankyrin repeat-containing domain protein [Rostrohypoxylon terebratum]|nr:ankyrin repeat-containing domain protein [Rostrohypoxylon terebratum]